MFVCFGFKTSVLNLNFSKQLHFYLLVLGIIKEEEKSLLFQRIDKLLILSENNKNYRFFNEIKKMCEKHENPFQGDKIFHLVSYPQDK
jgi:hypothetical protein